MKSASGACTPPLLFFAQSEVGGTVPFTRPPLLIQSWRVIEITGEMTAGEAAVATGTLLLAVFTWRLARGTRREVALTEQGLALTRESIEAQDRPFAVATLVSSGEGPRRSIARTRRALQLREPIPGHQDQPHWALMADCQNWGKGLAILEEASVRNAEGSELVTGSSTPWPRPLLPNERMRLVLGLGGLSDPSAGDPLELRLYYRAASGLRYMTYHQLEVQNGSVAAKSFEVARLLFRMEAVAPGL